MTEAWSEPEGLESPAPVMVKCPECHGRGEFCCDSGCHTTECPLCEGETEIWEGDVPV